MPPKAPVLVKSELVWWQHHEGTDTVRANVLHTFDTGEERSLPTGQDIDIPDADLQEHAEKAGKTTWDNDDVAAFAGAILGCTVVRKPKPEEKKPE